MDQRSAARYALLSVFDKRGLVPLASALVSQGMTLLASGGTAQHLLSAGLSVIPVEEFTGAEEILEGRVKTLHPKIHAGLLVDRRKPEHLAALEKSGYVPIDLLVCNLYPFAETVARGQSPAQIIEMIDIGGPAMIRAAAKNHAGGIAVVVDPADYPQIIAAIEQGPLPAELRQALAVRAFAQIAKYDQQIADWFARPSLDDAAQESRFPLQLGPFVRTQALRYGENPHQEAFLYRDPAEPIGAAHATPLQGKALSYTNLLDVDAAYRAVFGLRTLFGRPACTIVKHAAACGMAVADSQVDSYLRALSGDRQSAFGSVIAFESELSESTAQAMLDSKLFIECICAPGFSVGARALLAEKTNLRLLVLPASDPQPRVSFHRIGGGLLLQAVDSGVSDPASWQVVSRRPLDPAWTAELQFAEYAAMTLRSNAISVSKGLTLLGAGTGHVSRVDAATLALRKSAKEARGAFLGSDAFFPFPDCAEAAAAAGIAAIIQPGGSVRDAETIAVCERHNMTLVFSGRRHFRH